MKPFRTKTNARIRGSDRKNLRAQIEKCYSNDENKESLSLIATNKDEINVLKIFTHKYVTVVDHYKLSVYRTSGNCTSAGMVLRSCVTTHF